MTQVNNIMNSRKGTHLTYEGMCQVILGVVLTSIFVALHLCTLVPTTALSLAGLGFIVKFPKTRTLQ